MEGTLSVLADWQRSRGVPNSQQSRVQLTLRRAMQSRIGAKTDGSGAKAPLDHRPPALDVRVARGEGGATALRGGPLALRIFRTNTN